MNPGESIQITINRSPEYWESLVSELCKLTGETEAVEFKMNTQKPRDIGEYVSALANSCLPENDLSGL